MKRFTGKSHKEPAGRVDLLILSLIIFLLIFGLLMVYEASVVYSDLVFGGKYHFALLQLGWVILGGIGMIILSRIDLSLLKKYAPYIFAITIIILVFLLLPTIFSPTVYGAKRWLVLNPRPLPVLPVIGRISFQPSEFAKLATIIFVASFLSSKKVLQKNSIHVLIRFTLILLVVCALIALEPDFTTAFVVAVIALSLLFFANGSIYYFIIGVPAIAGVGLAYAFSSAYRRARIETLFHPEGIDTMGAGYHIRQIVIALGSGGLFGLGLGKSRQKYAYLPEVTADSIFAIVGEEFGFIGTAVLVILFAILIWRGLLIAKHSQDRFQSLLVAGVMVWIAAQVFINLAAMVRIMPLTGIPLPLVSYGGSSTIFILWGLGLVLNVSRSVKIEVRK